VDVGVDEVRRVLAGAGRELVAGGGQNVELAELLAGGQVRGQV
jgi:hypothetical protein